MDIDDLRYFTFMKKKLILSFFPRNFNIIFFKNIFTTSVERINLTYIVFAKILLKDLYFTFLKYLMLNKCTYDLFIYKKIVNSVNSDVVESGCS